MRYYLIQTGGGSAVPYLTRLASRLPDGFADRADVTLKNLGPPSDDGDGSRVVASFDAEDEEGLRALTDAVASLRNDAYTLKTDPPQVDAPLAAGADEIEALMLLIPELPGKVDTAEGEGPFAELDAIFGSTGSGESFPEESYVGAAARAYSHIVKTLGVEPRVDRAVAVRPGRIRDIKRPGRIRSRDWEPVVEHLEDEILFFVLTREWLGDSGHLMMLNDRQTDVNFAFLEELGDKYLGLKPSDQVTLVFDTMWTLACKAGGQMGGAAAHVTDLLRVLWKVTAAAQPNPKAATTARIDAMKKELTEFWAKQMSMLGKQHAKINGDWGLLQRFGALVSSARLRWPEDFSPIRRAFSVAFQIYALKQTMKKAPVGAEMVIKEEVKHPTVRKTAGWWKHACAKGTNDCYYDWALATKTYKTGEWCFAFYLGYKHYDQLSRKFSYIHADRPIQRKLFGTDVSSELDPELGFPARFLTDPKCKEREGWGLPQTIL